MGQFYWPGAIQDLTDWFTINEVVKKRDEIARLIRGLTKEQNAGNELNFPSIRFLPPDRTTRSKTRKKEHEHQSSDSEDECWGMGHTLGGQTTVTTASTPAVGYAYQTYATNYGYNVNAPVAPEDGMPEEVFESLMQLEAERK